MTRESTVINYRQKFVSPYNHITGGTMVVNFPFAKTESVLGFIGWHNVGKETFYFPHDYAARHDDRISVLLIDHGAAAYGVYWALIEILHEETNHEIVITPTFHKAFAKLMSTPVEQVLPILESCVEVGLLQRVGDILRSNRVDRNVNIRAELSQKRSKAGKASAEKRALDKDISTSVQQVLTPVEQIATKEKKRNENKKSVFTPPTLEDVLLYFRENGYTGGEKAFRHYHPDWKNRDGKQVKNWQQTMRTVWFEDSNKITPEQPRLISREHQDLNRFLTKPEDVTK